MVIVTIEIPQWRVDKVVDAPFYGGRVDSHLYGIRCSLEEYKMWIFWEKTSGIISVFNQHSLVRQWIHVRRQSTRLFGRFSWRTEADSLGPDFVGPQSFSRCSAR